MKTFIFLTWLAAGSADATTTHLALASGQGREVVLTQRPWVNDSILVGSGAATGAVMRKAYPEHPKLVWVLTIAGASFHTYAAIHNLRVAQH